MGPGVLAAALGTGGPAAAGVTPDGDTLRVKAAVAVP
jgi:hypothetical protein